MTAVLRAGLRLASLATTVLAVWLVGVVVLVLPARDPAHVGRWGIVAIAAAALAALSWVASGTSGAPPPAAGLPLLALGVASLAFGVLVIGSSLSDALTGDPEGYLLVIGAILAAHGALVVGWLAAVVTRRPG